MTWKAASRPLSRTGRAAVNFIKQTLRYKKMKVALSIGHAPDAPGSSMVGSIITEYEYGRDLAQDIQKHLTPYGIEGIITNRRQAGGNTPSYAAIACNNTGADLAIELHFNSAADPAATGTETLYYKDSVKGKAAAQLINNAMVSVLQLADRGIRTVPGYTSNAINYFKNTRMPAILIEPAFAGSNELDKYRLMSRRGTMAKAIARAIAQWGRDMGLWSGDLNAGDKDENPGQPDGDNNQGGNTEKPEPAPAPDGIPVEGNFTLNINGSPLTFTFSGAAEAQ